MIALTILITACVIILARPKSAEPAETEPRDFDAWKKFHRPNSIRVYGPGVHGLDSAWVSAIVVRRKRIEP